MDARFWHSATKKRIHENNQSFTNIFHIATTFRITHNAHHILFYMFKLFLKKTLQIIPCLCTPLQHKSNHKEDDNRKKNITKNNKKMNSQKDRAQWITNIIERSRSSSTYIQNHCSSSFTTFLNTQVLFFFFNIIQTQTPI